MKKIGIYKIVNKINGKYYVGGSKNIDNRWREHKADLRNNAHHNNYLQNSWNKYGEHNFEFTMIEKCDVLNTLITEQKYLDIAKNEKEKTYNLSFIAGGGDLSEETKKKIGLSLKNFYINNPEMKIHLSKIHTGYKQSKEHIENAAKAKMGKNHYLYGKHHSEEFKKKISGINHPRYDFTIYKFYNKLTNENFTGTRNGLYTKYGLQRQGVDKLIKKLRHSYKGWVIYEKD